MKNNSEIPTVGLVIVSYHSSDHIKKMFSTLGELDRSKYQVLVIVNSENDGKHDELEYDVVYSPQNIGFGQACNLGSSLLDSEFVLFVNPDVRVSQDVIDRMCKIMQMDKDIGILAPHSGGDEIIVEDEQKCVPAQGRNIGSCFMMSRSLFSRLGGFDPSFFLWWEDTDICERVASFGYRVCLVNGLVVSHDGGHSTSNEDPAQSAHLTRVWICSHFYYLAKHRGLVIAATWCISMTLWNLISSMLGRDRIEGRVYHRSSTAWRFGSFLLIRIMNWRRNTMYNGSSYAWSNID